MLAVGDRFGESVVVEDLGKVHLQRRYVIECVCGIRRSLVEPMARRRGACFHSGKRQRARQEMAHV